MRSHAVTMSRAQGQLACIFSCRPRAPRVRRAAASRAAVNHALFIAIVSEGNRPMPQFLAGPDAVLDPGVHPVGGVDAGRVGAPAPQRSGQVGDPQAVPPAVFGLEQGQLGAGVRPLAVGENPHAGQPAKVARRAFAQQSGQLSDVHSGGIDLRLAAWNPGILDTS